ncbi:MAG: NTP transferase domain-containing protein [Firmicutes bacterium]|nr:NTP transferase domain-containing protein [Bacillota bacterium]
MSFKVDNAIIMAAGTSSRFAPLSYERPKALIEVKGEVLLERQIKQLKAAGIDDIIIVTGYMHEQFEYLKGRFGVELIHNPDYLTRNNNSTIWAAKDRIRNSYICSSDNYFAYDPFETEVDDAYYAAVYADGPTAEWCMTEDAEGYIDSVKIGGENAWYMLGHAFWSEEYSRRFLKILADIYDEPETAGMLWEAIYMRHLDELKMKMRRYGEGVIFEFDTLDELRLFDNSYVNDTRSAIMKELAEKLGCSQAEMTEVTAFKDADNSAAGMRFLAPGGRFEYRYDTKELKKIKEF